MRLKTLLMLGAAAYAWKKYSETGTLLPHSRGRERELDEALDETFPASDPPSMTSPSTTAGIRSGDIKRH